MVPPTVRQAIDLYSAGKRQEGRDRLRDFLLQQPDHLDALLWLARITPDAQEAVAAAELALKLDPGSEVAQRAVVAVRQRKEAEPPQQARESMELRAAVTLFTGLTLTQARAIKWPFREINRPIGKVLDAGIITAQDLLWAAENAHDPRVVKAAKTILLTRLIGAEPEELRPLLKVIVGSRYSEWQERRSTAAWGLAVGIAFVLWIESIVWLVAVWVLKLAYGLNVPWWALYVPLFGLILAWVGGKLFQRFEDRADQYRQGRWGEEQAVEALRASLDGQWALFRNWEWPNRKGGDVDLILIGPGGVWAFEVKSYSGQVRNVGDRWERKGRRRWRSLTVHPGQQARRNASRLKGYLQDHGVDVGWVQPVVVWAGDETDLTVDDPATPVWTLQKLAEQSDTLWQGRGLSEEKILRVAGVLQQMTRDQK